MIPISGKTRVFCVLGCPVGHSLSPPMQNAALQAMGVDGVYVAFEVRPEDLADAIRGLEALGVAGVNCTIPHKEALIPLMDELSEEAARVGAVNTISFRDGRRTGHNTDTPGFLAALRAEGFAPEGKRAVVLGAGGSARAVTAALLESSASVTLVNRTVERARELAGTATGWGFRGELGALAIGSSEAAQAIGDADLLVNTTSVGMHPREGEMPPIPTEALHPNLFVYDLIYNPQETLLLRTARARGARGANGAGMLARQGALALELWTGVAAPAELMERVILENLAARQRTAAG